MLAAQPIELGEQGMGLHLFAIDRHQVAPGKGELDLFGLVGGLFDRNRQTPHAFFRGRLAGILENAARIGARLRAGLERELGGLPGVREIRGHGLMLGVDLDRPCGVLLGRAAEAGLLLSVTADSVIRIVPPLILSADEADQVVAILAPLVRAFLAEPAP